ncbi:hypothetical protein XSR1_220007 [Xenorhabdus szentirmaii DSM 16338]|uniref:Uncharacterized protein n=1 Tax=Xenorhabdus szentirmaii DSM 16338 TaxID=1427518 RepID=W1IW03_9GAMM|nr:hypothetical protein XSR1_220007 [Xenorhabdus szentirmaii DSM 16338]
MKSVFLQKIPPYSRHYYAKLIAYISKTEVIEAYIKKTLMNILKTR